LSNLRNTRSPVSRPRGEAGSVVYMLTCPAKAEKSSSLQVTFYLTVTFF
jgi:hypothetical protein